MTSFHMVKEISGDLVALMSRDGDQWMESYSTVCPWLIEAECCIYVLVNRPIFGSNNGLSPVSYQAVVWTNVGLFLFGPFRTNFNKNTTTIFIQENKLVNDIWKMVVILSLSSICSMPRNADVFVFMSTWHHKLCANNPFNTHLAWWHGKEFNILRPRQNGRHFPDDTFKWIFLNENVWISLNISLKFVPRGSINNIPTLVQVMAWRRPGDKPLSEPMMVRLPTHQCVTRPQWVKSFVEYATDVYMITNYIWGLWCQKHISPAGMSNCIPQYSVGCNYLSLPEIPASGTEVHICRNQCQWIRWGWGGGGGGGGWGGVGGVGWGGGGGGGGGGWGGGIINDVFTLWDLCILLRLWWRWIISDPVLYTSVDYRLYTHLSCTWPGYMGGILLWCCTQNNHHNFDINLCVHHKCYVVYFVATWK